ncbi:MAG: FAD:protein FMN transferase [Spongiibacteraceae bacterium]
MRRALIPQQTSPAAPSAGSVIFDFRGETMGTSWTVKLAAMPVTNSNWQHELQRGIQRELDLVVAQMSHWQSDSDLGRFNRADAGSWQTLPDAFFEVISFGLTVAKISDGAYDPTAGALVNLWGFGPCHRYDEPNFHPPHSDSVEAARTQSGWKKLAIDLDNRKIHQPGNLLLDLSAIAKGYAVDRVAHYLERCGVLHYLVEVGGELRGAGIKPDQLPWWVALEQPTTDGTVDYMPPAIAQTIVALHGLSIATSGDYRRFYRINDSSISQTQGSQTRVSHTIDPRSGYPIRNNIASVTVLHSSCMAADAFSTALTVLGVDDGMIFAEANHIAARFLVRDNANFSERTSSAFQAMLQ